MKKAFTIFLLLLAFAACKQHEPVEGPQASIKHTWPEVLAIAQKHGVDSTYIPYDKQSALMLDDEAEIVRFALATKKALDLRQQRRAFMANTYKIRNLSDYDALLDQYPLLAESERNSASWQRWRERMQKSPTWHIYRDSIGALRWMPPAQDPGFYEGETRIDNLPPVSISGF